MHNTNDYSLYIPSISTMPSNKSNYYEPSGDRPIL